MNNPILIVISKATIVWLMGITPNRPVSSTKTRSFIQKFGISEKDEDRIIDFLAGNDYIRIDSEFNDIADTEKGRIWATKTA